MALTLIITNAGRAALVNAAHSGTAPTVISQVGFSATAVTPLPTATSLPGEFKRVGAISGDVVAADTIHLIGRDESADVFTMRSFALYLADGTLFALYGQSTPIAEKAAQAMLLLAVDVRLVDIDASALTFGNANFLNPPATETVKGVAEIATQAETDSGTDDSRIVTPKKLASRLTSWLASWGADVWRASNDGAGSGLDADLLDGQQGSWYSNIIARLGFTPANKAGDTFTGTVIFDGGTGGAIPVLASPAGQYAYHRLRRPNGPRWDVGMDATAEGSGNTGSAFFINRFDNNAAFIETAFSISRATGAATFAGAVLRLGNKLWDAGNDGAGSGLDADLLDGLQASDFLLRSGGSLTGPISLPSLTVTGAGGTSGLSGGTGDGASYSTYNIALNVWYGLGIKTYDGSVNGYYDARAGAWDVKSGYRVNGVPTWHGANDGAGSGLDADLLDGQQGSWYADILARLGFTPVRQGGGIGQLANLVKIGWSGTRLKATVDAADLGNIVFDSQLSAETGDVWRSSNDGAGSGLDADLLDGYDSSAFDRIVAFSLIQNGGYKVRASGEIECWGYLDLPANSGNTWNLPYTHQAWVIPTYNISKSRYGDGNNTENAYQTAINVDGSGKPASLTFFNADNFDSRIYIATKGK